MFACARRLAAPRLASAPHWRACSGAGGGGGGGSSSSDSAGPGGSDDAPLSTLMQQELASVFGEATSIAVPRPRPPKPGKAKPLERRMVEHVLPNYLEVDYRTTSFVMTRAPKLSDFPNERVYRKESLDLLFRHYYKNSRS